MVDRELTVGIALIKATLELQVDIALLVDKAREMPPSLRLVLVFLIILALAGLMIY